MTSGEKIRAALEAQGMMQKELAAKTGLHVSTIAKYLRGENEPSFFNMCCIAKVLNLSLDYLAGWEDNNAE